MDARTLASGEPLGLRLLALGAVLAVVAFDAMHGSGLYADGANFLVQILAHRNFFHVNPSRVAAEVLLQFPVVAALRLGITTLPLLLAIHCAWLLILPAACWLGALYHLRRDDAFWWMFLLFCVVYFNAAFFAIGEFNLAYALVALSLAIWGAAAPPGPRGAAVAGAAALCLVAAYEAMVFLGPVLAVLTWARMRAPRLPPAVAALGGVAILADLAGVAVAAQSIWSHRQSPMLAHALQPTTIPLLVLSLVGIGGYVASLSASPARRRIALALAGATALAMIAPATWSSPARHYEARVPVGIVVFAFGAALAAQWLRTPARQLPLPRRPALVPLLLLGALAVSDIARSRQFAAFLDTFRAEVRGRTGVVALEDTALGDGVLAAYGWAWTYPSLSLLLRAEARQAIILNPRGYAGFQPFDAHVALPDLGVYYSGSR